MKKIKCLHYQYLYFDLYIKYIFQNSLKENKSNKFCKVKINLKTLNNKYTKIVKFTINSKYTKLVYIKISYIRL